MQKPEPIQPMIKELEKIRESLIQSQAIPTPAMKPKVTKGHLLTMWEMTVPTAAGTKVRLRTVTLRIPRVTTLTRTRLKILT
jgi:hypothetical protein